MADEKALKDDELEKEDSSSKDTKEKKKKEKKLKPKEEIAKLAQENHDLRESYLASKAELENFKRRNTEERIRDRKYAASNLLHNLLNPLDQLKKVVEMETDDKKLNNFLIGFKMINKQIYDVLENDGLKEIEALNKEFDPKFHHAVEKVENRDLANGTITEVTQIGYMYKDRVLRPAMVKVNEWSVEENE